MRDLGQRPSFRSDLVLVELRDATAALPQTIAGLQGHGQITAIDAPWSAQPADSRLDVDPRVSERLRELLGRVRILHLAGVTPRRLVDECAGDPAIARAGLVPLRITCAARRRSRAEANWNLDAIRMRHARRLPGFRDADDIHVTLLDTGLDGAHPDLKRMQPRVVGSAIDIEGHGTHTAGIILGRKKNRFGLRGMCACRMTMHGVFGTEPAFVSPDDGFRFLVDECRYLAALAQCARERVDVLQFGFASLAAPHFVETALLEFLLECSTILVAPMGNDRGSGSPVSWPAASPGVIAVAASTLDDRVATFSSAGPHVTLAAPGVAIWSAAPVAGGLRGNRYDPELGLHHPGAELVRPRRYMALDGTSAAASHVTGAIALLLANRGKDTPQRVRERLTASAFATASRRKPEPDSDLGAGILDVERLLSP